MAFSVENAASLADQAFMVLTQLVLAVEQSIPSSQRGSRSSITSTGYNLGIRQKTSEATTSENRAKTHQT
jgi:hypothetical protein